MSLSTVVTVCSNALLSLGAQSLNSLDDLSDRARAAANLFPQIRDSLLRAHPWNCAIKRVVLSPDVDPPPFGYARQFSLPGDWLRTLSIGQSVDDRPDYETEGGKILTDESVVYLRYVFRNENPSTWDAQLDHAMTVAMAAVLALPATGNETMAQAKNGELMALLKAARAADGQEDPPQTIGDFRLLGVRG